MELINADSTSQRNKTIAGWKKSSAAWGVGVGVGVGENFPDGIVISKYAQIQILTLR